MKINKENNIAVYKTLDNDYISNCVKKVITNSCKLSRRITPKTKAVLVIHEFGYPCKEIIELKKICTKKKIHLIENCAWGFGSSINKEIKIGELGDYVIYSLPKIFPMQYGGVLKGLSIPDKENWEKYQRLDYYKKELILKQLDYFGKKINIFNKRRLKNWNYLNKLFLKDGIDPFCKPDENVFPAVYIAKLKNYQKLYEKYLKFGVEVGRYYQEGALFLPIHQNLSTQHLDYIYGIFRGDLNLCNTYRRIKK